MNIDLDAVFKAPFQQKDWMRRLSIPFAFNLLYVIIYGVSQFAPYLFSFSSSRAYGMSNSYSNNTTSLIVVLLLAGLSVVLSIVYSLYTTGYNLTATQNVVNGDEKEYLPEPTAWGRIFGNGGKIFVVGLAYTLVVAAIVLLVFIVFSVLGLAGSTSSVFSSSSSQLARSGAFFTLCCCGIYGFMFAASILLYGFLIPSSTYLLAAHDSIADALNPAKVFAVVKKAFPQLLLLLGLNMLVGFIIGIIAVISIFTFCFAIVIIPALMTLSYAYSSYIMGIVFKEIKSKKL